MSLFVGRDSPPEVRRYRAVLLDVAVAVASACLVTYAPLDPPGPAYAGPGWVAAAVGAAAGLPLLLRRRWGVPVLVWVVLVAAAATVTGVVGAGVVWTTYVPVAVASYTAANLVDRFLAAAGLLVVGLGAAAVAIPAYYGIHRPADSPSASEVPLWWQVELATVVVLVGAAWAAGRVVRSRRVARARFARHSAREAVAEERLRIARELHDVLGHSMSLIAIRATVAARLADSDPEHARAALGAIEQTSRSAMTEIRGLLGVLRPTDDDPVRLAVAGDAARTPLPGCADLPALVDRFRAPGLAIDLEVDGVDGTAALPPGVDLAVFRVVQEALTNIAKHAGAGRCRITIGRTTGAVRIEVVDDGPPRRRHQGGGRDGGHGLIGMRERVAAHGGTLAVGPLAGGGFRVLADIPHLAPDAASDTAP